MLQSNMIGWWDAEFWKVSPPVDLNMQIESFKNQFSYIVVSLQQVPLNLFYIHL